MKNQKIIQRYGEKCTSKTEEEGEILSDINKGDVDTVMFLLWLGCKLASQKLENASSKVAFICKLLSDGEMVQRDHLHFLI
jgi:hypothetical protein